MQPMTTCLWFDSEGEEAANYYVSVFPSSRITGGSDHPGAGTDGIPAGLKLTVEFELHGMKFLALNGGKLDGFVFSPATSFMIHCEDQAEIDHFWRALSAVPEAEQCGWCTDRYGVTWQVIPKNLVELISNPATAEKATELFMQMKKIDIAALVAAGNA